MPLYKCNGYGMKKTLLWTNSEPKNKFVAQTVLLDLTGYDYVEIECARSATYPTSTDTNIIKVDGGYHIVTAGCYGASSANLYNRKMNFVENGIYFEDGYISHTANQPACEPLKIYGIKGQITE